jgi:ABC-type glycerol-3-phosphate transport system substrate-binding protein
VRCVPILLALALATGVGAGAARAERLTLACLDVGRMVEACRAAATRFAAASGHTVRVVAADASGRDALERYGALFGIESSRLDVVTFPEAWIPTLAPDLATLDVPAEAAAFIPQLLAGGRADGRLVGLPQHVAITLLFLRSDLVAADDASLWESVRKGLLAAPTEGASLLSFGGAEPTLFAVVLDWLYSFGGAGLDDRDRLVAALRAMDAVVGNIASAAVVSTTGKEALGDFTGGNSAALVDRSTVLSAVEGSPLSGVIRAVSRPRQGGVADPAPVLASVWYVGVSSHSAQPDAAADLARFLVAEDTQRISAIEYGLAPTLAPLYRDEAVLGASAVFREIAKAVPQMRLPPVARYGVAYLELSDRVSDAVRAMLRGETEPEAAAAAVTRAARRASREADRR